MKCVFIRFFFIQNLAGFFIFFCIDETYFRFWHLNINEFGPILRCTRQSIVHHTPDDLMGRMQWCIDTPSLIRYTLHFSVSLSLPLTAIPPFPNHYFCQQSSPMTPPALRHRGCPRRHGHLPPPGIGTDDEISLPLTVFVTRLHNSTTRFFLGHLISG